VIPAIILAGGASSRMGRTKALLPLPGGGWFLQRIDTTLRAAGVAEVVAVIAHDVDSISAAVGDAHLALKLVRNPDSSRGQLSSLLTGLDAVERADVPAVLVTTVDLPLVAPDTVRRVIDAWRSTGAAIVRPELDGRHGHPVIFAASMWGALRAADPAEGARAVLRAHRDEILDVAVDDRGAFDDVDTPADYARLLRSAGDG
jgi:CTP:molybdopterin cytidylyltransferase MocA